MVRRLWFSAAMLTVGTSLLVAAAVAWSAERADAPKGGTLRLGSVFDVESVDPALSYEFGLEFATCAKLFNYPDASGAAGTRVIPELVKSWTVSKDGRTYDFEMKRTFRFHTGAAVTARSFAAAFNRDANPRLESPARLQGYMREIVGAVAVMQGRAKAISGVRALGRYRLQIRLTRPVGDFTARLTMPFFCPILPNTPIVPEGIDNPPGSGPYYVAERVVNRLVVLKRNPFYQGGRPANVDQVVWMVGETAEGCFQKVEENQLDLCLAQMPNSALPRRLVERYGVNRPGGQFFRSPISSTAHFVFNHDRRAFRGPGQIALKKAINYAIDRPALTRAYPYLVGIRTDQILPAALGRDTSVYPLGGADPATARKWYARAEYKPQRLVYYATNDRFGIALAQVLQFNLKQIGIELELKYYDYPTKYEKIGTRGEPFDISYNNWAPDWPDPAAFFEPLLTPNLRTTGNSNYPYFVRPWVTRRMEAASRLTGPARRKAWADLDADLMRDDPPWAPIVHNAYRTFVSPSFGCLVDHPVYGVDFAAACKKK